MTSVCDNSLAMNPKRSTYEIVFEDLFFFTGNKISDLKDTENQVLVILRKVGPPMCPQCGSVHSYIEERYTHIVREPNPRYKNATSNLKRNILKTLWH